MEISWNFDQRLKSIKITQIVFKIAMAWKQIMKTKHKTFLNRICLLLFRKYLLISVVKVAKFQKTVSFH